MICYDRGHQTTARELISSGPPHAAGITAALQLLRKKVTKFFVKD